MDEKAYIGHENPKQPPYLVVIASEGRWNKDKQQIEYQLRLGTKDGPLYKNGALIEERLLCATCWA